MWITANILTNQHNLTLSQKEDVYSETQRKDVPIFEQDQDKNLACMSAVTITNL